MFQRLVVVCAVVASLVVAGAGTASADTGWTYSGNRASSAKYYSAPNIVKVCDNWQGDIWGAHAHLSLDNVIGEHDLYIGTPCHDFSVDVSGISRVAVRVGNVNWDTFETFTWGSWSPWTSA